VLFRIQRFTRNNVSVVTPEQPRAQRYRYHIDYDVEFYEDLHEVDASPEEEAIRLDKIRHIINALSALSARERHIVLRLLEEAKQIEVARELGLSRERIRQLRNEAFEVIRPKLLKLQHDWQMQFDS
jgi:RNA polymerase sigma factor (sigma-70 family)